MSIHVNKARICDKQRE